MTHLFRHLPHPCQPWPASRRHRKRFLIPLAGLSLALAACSSPATPDLPVVPVTDTVPVGDGLKTLAFALLGGAVVIVLGGLIRR